MKYLYELTLKHGDKILNRVSALCDKDPYINVNGSCMSNEVKYNLIQLLFGLIFDSLRSLWGYSIEDAFDSTIHVNIEDFNSYDLHFHSLRGTDIKIFIAVLKHFRSSINEIIFQSLEDKSNVFRYIDANIKCFDSLEYSLYQYWEETDIADKNKIEELQHKASVNEKLLNEVIEYDKIRSEFFSNLSHELRTPLNVILGTLQLVDMYSSNNPGPMMDKTRKYYKIMRQNCYRLLRLVNNLIDLNKLDAGYMSLREGNHDIIGIISDIVNSVADYIENKGIEFHYHTMIRSKIIACDPDMIERILLNLLSNSIKFTDQGGKINVFVWDEEDKVFISVKDNGIGIPEEKRHVIFKRFVQIEKSLSRNQNGSGIGLSLVKSLVELHGGKISLASGNGNGTEFVIELPARQQTVMETPSETVEYRSNRRIEVIKIEFSDIYS